MKYDSCSTVSYKTPKLQIKNKKQLLLEECVMQLLIIDVYLSQLRSNLKTRRMFFTKLPKQTKNHQQAEHFFIITKLM